MVVVNYGSLDLLEANLDADDWGPTVSEVVVVDNFTTDRQRNALRDVSDRRGWELVELDRNVGFGAGMNAGVARARELGCTVFLLLNPDASITRPVIESLYDSCVADPLTMVAPRIISSNGNVWFSGATVLMERGETSTAAGTDSSAPGGWLSGACMAVHADLWARLDGFDDDYFLYWEDVDLSWRCTAVGGDLVVRPDLTVIHSVGGTQKGRGKSAGYAYYNCRNRLRFATKHLTRTQRLRWMARSPIYAIHVCTRGSGRRVLLRRPTLLVAALGGTLAGTFTTLRSLAA